MESTKFLVECWYHMSKLTQGGLIYGISKFCLQCINWLGYLEFQPKNVRGGFPFGIFWERASLTPTPIRKILLT